MRFILKRRDFVFDEWRYLGEEGAVDEAASGGGIALIVPFAEFRAHLEKWRAYQGPLGVRLSPPDKVEDLAEDIHRLALIAAEFPGPGEGRGYSQGRLLRTRLKFKGELRAVGAGVKQDLLFILARCGFDAFDLAPGQRIDEALNALERYSVAYQPAEPVPGIGQQRYPLGPSALR